MTGRSSAVIVAKVSRNLNFRIVSIRVGFGVLSEAELFVEVLMRGWLSKRSGAVVWSLEAGLTFEGQSDEDLTIDDGLLLLRYE